MKINTYILILLKNHMKNVLIHVLIFKIFKQNSYVGQLSKKILNNNFNGFNLQFHLNNRLSKPIIQVNMNHK